MDKSVFGRLMATIVYTCVCLVASFHPADAGTAHPVLDINKQNIAVHSFPTDFADQGAWSFLDANDGVNGSQPWLTNGTTAGTFMWGHVTEPGSGVTGLSPVFAGGHSFILYQEPISESTKIWVSDGTQSGSHALSTLTAASAGVNAGLVGSLGNNAVLTFFNRSTNNRDLWVSDGTDAGTRRVQSASGAAFSVRSAVFTNGKMYFTSELGSSTTELWVSDGTTAGTARVGQIPNTVPDSSTLVVAGNHLLFNATTTGSGRELWSFDITTNVLIQVADIAPGSASGLPSNTLWQVGNVAVFPASVTGNNNTTLWRSDGTQAGTYSISSVTPANFLPNFFTSSGSSAAVFIVATSNAQQLWGTDGTAAGTQLLSTASGSEVYAIGGRFYFWSYVSFDMQLWTTDGTLAGTHALTGLPYIQTGSGPQIAGTNTTIYARIQNVSRSNGSIIRYDLATSTSSVLTNFTSTAQPPFPTGVFAYAQGRLYFDNEDPIHGRELWTSDGTPAGTTLLKNIAPETQTQSSNPTDFVAFNGKLYFTADDGVVGREVWYSDGTSAGTQILKDINPGDAGSAPSDLFVANGALYFFATDGARVSHLWRSDGTPEGTQAIGTVATVPLGDHSYYCNGKGVAVGGTIYFAGYDGVATQLWKTDGTQAGTVPVTQRPASTSSSLLPCRLIALGNRLYFQGSTFLGHEQLWSSDGTTAGTAPVANINPSAQGSFVRYLTVLNNKLFFLADDGTHGMQLWTSDGTSAGTQLSTLLGTSYPVTLQTSAAGYLMLTALNAGVNELWISDGTSAGTMRLARNLTDPWIFMNGKFAYYRGSSPEGLEPWVSDGTSAGTAVLLSINPYDNALADGFLDFNGTTFFQATSTGGARQLWRTNGTAAGTKVAANIVLGPQPLAAGQNLFFSYNDSTTGTELWALNNDQPIAVADAAGNVTAGSSVTVNVLANDSDPDGTLNPASVTIVTGPSHGTVSVSTSGTITFTANGSYSGPDTFSYTVADDQGYASMPANVTATVVAATSPNGGNGNGNGSGGGGGGGGGGALVFEDMLLLALGWFLRQRLKRNSTSA